MRRWAGMDGGLLWRILRKMFAEVCGGDKGGDKEIV